MSITASIWLVIVAGFVAANIPFFNQRILAAGPRGIGGDIKPLWIRLAELVLLYALVGALALLLEGRAGQRSPQGWEFYAITATLFLTFAFPGFVYQYLLRKHHRGD
ncbi:MAG: DUF2818 family protein [Comamonas sp.]|jgi:hypothetical protein